jgi:hypothetical protein
MTYTQVAPWYNATSTVDTGFSRAAAGVIAAGTGAASNNGATLLTSVYGFGATSTATSADTGISRLAAGSLAIGSGTAGSFSGTLKLATGVFTAGSNAIQLTTANSSISFSSNSTGPQGLVNWLSSTQTSLLGIGANQYTSLDFEIFSAGLTGGAGDIAVFNHTTGSMKLPSPSVYGWSSTAAAQGTVDTGISRLSAGVLGIGTGAAASTAGSLVMTTATVSSTLYGGVYWSAGNAGVTQAAEAVGTIATTGGIVTTFTAVSDERLKISTLYLGGLEELLGITPIRYRWNAKGQELSGQTGDRDYIGFSAQNVEKSIPEAIQSKKGPEQYLSFDDRPVICLLVNAVKELAARVKQLEATA